MAVFGFVVDAPRAADAPEIDEQRLQARLDGAGVGVGFFESQTLEGETVLPETLGDAVFGLVVGEEDDFGARVK